MTIAQAFNEITIAQGGTPSTGGTITGAIDALNDTLAGSDQKPAATIEGAIRLLGAHIGGGVAPSGTISITENGEGIDVAQYAYADVNVSGGGSSTTTTFYMVEIDGLGTAREPIGTVSADGVAVESTSSKSAYGGDVTVYGYEVPTGAFIRYQFTQNMQMNGEEQSGYTIFDTVADMETGENLKADYIINGSDFRNIYFVPSPSDSPTLMVLNVLDV